MLIFRTVQCAEQKLYVDCKIHFQHKFDCWNEGDSNCSLVKAQTIHGCVFWCVGFFFGGGAHLS